MIEKVKEQVFELLNKDNSGHGIDHINRVLKLSLKFAEKENADKDIVSLIALLHDVDDYKTFKTENLDNARLIMNKANISEDIQNKVLSSLNCIGYKKRLNGFKPDTIEGKIVSDADMCDALGANGILRTHIYTTKNGKPFFDRNIFPIENMTGDKYTRMCADTSVCHMFEKVLKLKGLMLTNAGREEAQARHQIVIDFLYQLFNEEDAEEWIEYLNNYLAQEEI